MKRLILVRHAKSSWANPGQEDIDRPLNERGERNAPEMGRRLRERGELPARVVSSPARRALATARLMAVELGIARGDIVIEDALYEASVATWIKVITALPAGLDAVLMVGHNPTLTELANLLCRDVRIDNVPTCGVLRLDYEMRDWTVFPGIPPVAWFFDYPKRPGA
jgi:phosphohistidine phosphatase